MLTKYLKVQYLYLAFLIIWGAIYRALDIDGAGRIMMTVTVLAILYLISGREYKRTYKEPAIKIMIVLIGYTIINYLAKYQGSEPLLYIISYCFNIVYPLLMLTIVYYEIRKNREHLLYNLLIFVFYTWVMILLTLIDFNIFTISRLKIPGTDANDFAFVSFTIIFLSYLKQKQFGSSGKNAILLSILPMILIISSASRTAFGCVVILAVWIMIEKLKRITPAKIYLTILAGILAYASFQYLIEETYIGERFRTSTKQTETYKDYKTDTVLDKMGDRGVFYYFGFFAWLDAPVTGIGLYNFRENNIFNHLVCHSEYMSQLSENGLIGFLLYVMFLITLWRRIRRSDPRRMKIKKGILYSVFGMILFIDTFFWTYDRLYIFMLYGMILGYTSTAITKRNEKRMLPDR